MKPKHPHYRLIKQFGGVSKVAQLLGQSRAVVSHWGVVGVSPAGKWPLAFLAKQKGIKLPRDFPVIPKLQTRRSTWSRD